MSGGAVPGWLQQILPPWFHERPEFTEAAYAATKSFGMAAGTIIGTVVGVAVTGGHANSARDFLAFMFYGGGLWGAFIGFCVGGGWAKMRANEAGKKAAAAVQQNGNQP